MESPVLLTFGTSNLEWEDWLSRLRLLSKDHGVGMVVDVRSIPHSKRHPWFDGPTMRQSLNRSGFDYWYLGQSLGGRPRSRSLYHSEGHAWFERIRATDVFQSALAKLINATKKIPSVMICGEEDPLECHRGLMISPALVKKGATVLHIRRGNRIETTDEFENRMMRSAGIEPSQGNLFDSPGESTNLQAAYEWFNRRMAFRFDPDFVVEP